MPVLHCNVWFIGRMAIDVFYSSRPRRRKNNDKQTQQIITQRPSAKREMESRRPIPRYYLVSLLARLFTDWLHSEPFKSFNTPFEMRQPVRVSISNHMLATAFESFIDKAPSFLRPSPTPSVEPDAYSIKSIQKENKVDFLVLSLSTYFVRLRSHKKIKEHQQFSFSGAIFLLPSIWLISSARNFYLLALAPTCFIFLVLVLCKWLVENPKRFPPLLYGNTSWCNIAR